MVKFPGMSRKEIEKSASDIVRAFHPAVLEGKAPFNIDRFIEIVENELKIDFDFTSDLPPGVHGCTSTIDNKVLILSELSDDPNNLRYLRSTVAHETGHVLFHLPMLKRLCTDKTFTQKKAESKNFSLYSQKPVKAYEDPEWQAWEFAGSLLMPKIALVTLKEKGASVGEMADTFMVNQVFVRKRLRDLKMT